MALSPSPYGDRKHLLSQARGEPSGWLAACPGYPYSQQTQTPVSDSPRGFHELHRVGRGWREADKTPPAPARHLATGFKSQPTRHDHRPPLPLSAFHVVLWRRTLRSRAYGTISGTPEAWGYRADRGRGRTADVRRKAYRVARSRCRKPSQLYTALEFPAG